jgi:hypothetical protein
MTATNIIGVSRQGRRYQADIWLNGRTVYLGTFDTKSEAAAARRALTCAGIRRQGSGDFSPADSRGGGAFPAGS